jgi:hypothetical protein
MSAPAPEWDKTGWGWVLIDDGMTYIEAEAVRKWISRADPELAKKWEVNVDHMVRTGMEKASRKRSRWWSAWTTASLCGL